MKERDGPIGTYRGLEGFEIEVQGPDIRWNHWSAVATSAGCRPGSYKAGRQFNFGYQVDEIIERVPDILPKLSHRAKALHEVKIDDFEVLAHDGRDVTNATSRLGYNKAQQGTQSPPPSSSWLFEFGRQRPHGSFSTASYRDLRIHLADSVMRDRYQRCDVE